jgi:hypothetical protein
MVDIDQNIKYNLYMFERALDVKKFIQIIFFVEKFIIN